MKKAMLWVLLVAAIGTAPGQPMTDRALRDDVKSVQLYRPGSELDFPVLTLGDGGQLTLEFDVLGSAPEGLRWSVVHCDRHWEPDGLEASEFMSGFDSRSIDRYDFSFTTLRDYVHYSATVPGSFAEFTHSGNYLLTVSTDDEAGRSLLRRRFCVNEATARGEVGKGRPYDGVDMERRQELDVKVRCPELGFGRSEYVEVVVQQNGRTDNVRRLEFSGYDGDALAYRYRQANIFAAGNTFRFFDCSNLRAAMYNVVRVEEYGGELFAILRPEEDRSAKHYLSETTLNGGMKVNVWDREDPRLEADYVWVNFSLPMAQPMLDGTVHIVGALTDWRIDSTSAMEYNPRYRAYTKRLLLKQGYYAYQLLVKRPTQAEAETRQLEGDHRETPNTYTVYIYWRSPSDRADRLVGYQVIKG